MTFGHEVTYKTLDRGYIELAGPKGITAAIQNVTKITSRLQSGLVYHYAFVILLFLALQL
jgi:hypothetical protein